MSDIFSLIFGSGLVGNAVNSTRAYMEWIGGCFSGSCGTTPTAVVEMLTGIGEHSANTASFIGNAVSKLFLGIFGFLPLGGGLPQVIHDAFIYFGNTLATVNFILPVPTLIFCMSLIFSVKIALWSFHVIRLIISFARGVGVNNYRF